MKIHHEFIELMYYKDININQLYHYFSNGVHWKNTRSIDQKILLEILLDNLG